MDNNEEQIPPEDEKAQDSQSEPKIRFLDGPIPSPYGKTISPITELIGALQSVDTNSPQGKLNRTSISDNNGGRIELNQENIIKK